MHTRSKLVLATVLATSLGLATLGVVRAQTADTATADSAVTTTTSTTAATGTLPPRGERHAEMLAERATALGMTAEQLQTELQSGKPMYQIAAEHGVTYEEEKATHLATLKTRLDDMVKVGYMTQAQADAAYAEAQTSAMPFGPGLGMHGHGPRM